MKKKYLLGIITGTILTLIATITIVILTMQGESVESITTKTSYAGTTTKALTTTSTEVVGTWDISATEQDNVTATLYSDGKLVISGTGAMTSWSSSSNVPWYSNRESITEVEIQQGVTSIGMCAFEYCSSLTSIEIPDSVTRIESYAFYNCRSLTSIDIPDSVKSIWMYAFLDCRSLTSIVIPDSVTSIGSDAFTGCTSLTSINVDQNNQKYSSEDGILFNKDKTELILYPAKKTETSYIIPDSVTRIESYAFYNCRSLTSIVIPDSVTSIGSDAFTGCTSLTSISIPEGVTSIGYSTFCNCTSLTSIEVPSGVTRIGGSAFRACTSLTSIVIPDSVTSIGDFAFSDCSSLTSIVIPSGVTSIENHAFYDCSSLTSIVIPSGVTSIGDYAFSDCSSLTSIEIPDSVTSIGSEAFYKCISLTSIVIPDSVTSIGSNAFRWCTHIEAVATGENKEGEITIQLPELVKRTLDENDILYANGKEPTLTKCTISEEGTMTFNTEDIKKQNVKIEINSGALEGVVVVVVVPSGTIFYSETKPTNKDVTATIYIAEGEEITNNEGSKEHTFTENGEFTFKYTDKEGKEQTSTAVVNNIIKLSSETYKIEENKISKIQPKTAIEKFKKNITTNATEIKIYKEEGQEIGSTEEIETGMTLKLNNALTYTLIVTGDTNKDGEADLKDILELNKHRLNKAKLEGIRSIAGDINEDGKIDLKDILQLNKYRLGKIQEL